MAQDPASSTPVWPFAESSSSAEYVIDESVPIEESIQMSPLQSSERPSELWQRIMPPAQLVCSDNPKVIVLPNSNGAGTAMPKSNGARELSRQRTQVIEENINKKIEDIKKMIEDKGGYKDCGKYENLRRAAADEDWHAVKIFIEENSEALTAKLSDWSDTILHYMINSNNSKNIIRFVREIVQKLEPEDLEITDMSGLTALASSAIVGNKEAAEIMVQRNPKLPNIPDIYDNLPFHHAARFGHEDMVKFLLQARKKEEDPFTDESDVKLLENLITAKLYGIALKILKDDRTLARKQLTRKRVLETLAQKPLGFESGSQLELGSWKHLIYKCIPDSTLPADIRGDADVEDISDSSLPDIRGSGDVEDPKNTSKHCFTKCTQFSFLQRISATCGAMCKKLLYITIRLVPGIKSIHDTKLKHKQTYELVKLMCEGVTWNFNEALDVLKRPIHIAARLGIQEIVDEIIKAYPYSAVLPDDKGYNVFQLAVLHRQEKVFSVIYKMGVGIDWLVSSLDHSRNNILHLAGKLAPSSRVSGAALQMQRELQWYKVVEETFHSSLQEEKNSENLTPRELFTKEHTELVKAGQEWIKDAATSCSVVAALIITVAFASAITVPGGNDSQGQPTYLNEKSFLIFAMSNALALFFSTTSVLMFLGILTSRYSEEDFLESLPRKMMIGLITLFISIVAMMVAFVAALDLLVFHPLRWVIFPVILLACLPVALFALLQFPLLVEMFRYTYGPSFIQQPKEKPATKSKSNKKDL